MAKSKARAQYPCKHCHKAFRNKSECQRHEYTHLPGDQKPFKCDICNLSFSQRVQLRNHRNVHTREQPHLCQFCGRAFGETGAKSRHEKEQHSDWRGYQCSKCPTLRIRKGDFLKHMWEQHHVDPKAVNTLDYAVTKTGKSLDVARRLREQLHFDVRRMENAICSTLSHRERARRAAPPNVRRAVVKDEPAAADDNTAPSRLTLRASKKRERLDDDDDEDSKPSKRTRVTGQSASGHDPVLNEDPFAGLYTIPQSDYSPSEVGSPGGSSPHSALPASTPSPECEPQYPCDTFAQDVTSYDVHAQDNVPMDILASATASDNFPMASIPPLLITADNGGLLNDFGLLTAQDARSDLDSFNALFGLDSSLDGSYGFNEGFDFSSPSGTAPAISRALPSVGMSSVYSDYASAPSVFSADLLSATSPLTPSSQGSSRCPSPLGLLPADTSFSVLAISGLGRARQNALLMPVVHQDVVDASFFNAYAGSL